MGLVYLVTNSINGKRYVGKTVGTFAKRRRDHERDARQGSDLYFHNALRKYGTDAFVWEILLTHADPRVLCDLERSMIRSLKTRAPNGYNVTDGGEGVVGLRHSAESIAKMVQHHRGKKLTVEHKAKISAASLASWQTEERRKKNISALTGRVVSADTRARISAAHRGMKRSAQAKANIAASRVGRKLSAEHRAHIGAARRGHRHTAESKAKMSAQVKASWQRRKHKAAIGEQP